MVKNSAGKLFTIACLDVDSGSVTSHELSHDGSGGSRSTVEYADVVACYRISMPTIEIISNWTDTVPHKQKEYVEAVARAEILVALASLGRDGSTGLRLQAKPTRTTFAEETLAANKLVLVPETTRMMPDSGKHTFS